MAANFQIVYQRQTEELVGGARVRDVIEVGFNTLPSEIYSQIRIEYVNFGEAFVLATVSVTADNIETVMLYPYVAGMLYIQDINAAGLLIDVMEIIVTSDSGNSSALWHQPVALMYPPIVVPHLLALNEKLTAIEAL